MTFDELKDKLLTSDRNLPVPVISYMENDILHIVSKEINNGVPLFVVKISQDLTYENYHLGVKCIATTLSVNSITTLNKWSRLEENIRFLKCLEVDQKKNIIHQQLQVMGPPCVGKPLYTSECIVRAFEYFSKSRSLYYRLRKDFQLPSVQTLNRITSRVAKKDENSFLTGVFKCLPEKQKLCVLIQDEVYVKKMLLYHGGEVFGRSVDDPQCLAKTVLGIMVSCMIGGPDFLSNIMPVSKLNSGFLRREVDLSIQNINEAGGNVKAVICDGNRINQAFIKSFDTCPETPWVTKSGLFLIYDYVHILKNIQNYWLTEKTRELKFMDGDIERTAKWFNLVELHKLETVTPLVKMSALDEVAVSPKPI